jgi:hypothetical protein
MAETKPDELLANGLAIKTARAIQEHLERAGNVHRMQTEQQLGEVLEFRDEFRRVVAEEKSAQEIMIEKLTTAIDRLVTVSEREPKQVPVQVTLDSQPVNVNVPEKAVKAPTVRFEPQITVPEATVTVEASKAPTKATIKHSDGTMSTIEFK